jgi:hypothetical protein
LQTHSKCNLEGPIIIELKIWKALDKGYKKIRLHAQFDWVFEVMVVWSSKNHVPKLGICHVSLIEKLYNNVIQGE